MNNNFFSCKQKLLLCCYIIPVLCFFLLPLKVLYFACYVEVPLDSKLKHVFLKKISLKIFQSVLCRMDKWNLFLSINVFLFDVLTILIHHFVLFFSILSPKKKFCIKRKNKLHDFFFGHIFYEIHYLPKWYHNDHNECKQHAICYSAIQTSI